jgi:hypothetical protein
VADGEGLGEAEGLVSGGVICATAAGVTGPAAPTEPQPTSVATTPTTTARRAPQRPGPLTRKG